MNLITNAIAITGLLPLAKTCDVSYQAVRRWEQANRLPRTELTGETNYAKRIARLTKNKITRRELLAMTSAGWLSNS
jgi:uncharacterized MAPEG superfamily protein